MSSTASTFIPAEILADAVSTTDVSMLSFDAVTLAMHRIERVNAFFKFLYEDLSEAPQDDQTFLERILERWDSLKARRDALKFERWRKSQTLVGA